MKRRVFPQPMFILLALLPVLLACSLLRSVESPVTTPDNPVSATRVSPTKNSPTPIPPTATSKPSPTATLQPSPTNDSGKVSEPIRQWAADAEASSEYGSDNWSAYQAVGEPDTPDCGDEVTAWASANSDTIDWLNVYFNVPVYPSEIRIIQTYYPDQVSQVDLIDMQGNFVTIYTSQPRQVEDPCPYTLSIPVNEDTILVQGVRITIDQTVVQYWNEIDAVEIIGIPEVEAP